jgi:HD superfamily phosphohydrolase
MIIKDEIYGTIRFSELEERVIDSAEFQRLRRIKQMSVTNLVYPGANHTRFEHSLGTAHLSSLMAARLCEDEAEKIKLYGLVHDIGHTAFSHEGEDVLEKYIGDHEALAEEKITRGEVADIISENYNPREIVDIGKSSFGNIINSDLGADRMDYLKRDALNTGVAYGIIDIDRIVHTVSMEEGELVIDKGGLEAAEYLLVARFMMFSAVYLHKTVRIATALLYRAIEGSLSDGTIKPSEFTLLDDEAAMAMMAKSKEGGRYASALNRRKLYKEVCSFPKEGWDPAGTEDLEKELSKRFDCDIIVDYPHPFFKPVRLIVKTDEGKKPITALSKLVLSLEEAEEERMQVLVLAEEGIKKKHGDRIKEFVSSP